MANSYSILVQQPDPTTCGRGVFQAGTVPSSALTGTTTEQQDAEAQAFVEGLDEAGLAAGQPAQPPGVVTVWRYDGTNPPALVFQALQAITLQG